MVGPGAPVGKGVVIVDHHGIDVVATPKRVEVEMDIRPGPVRGIFAPVGRLGELRLRHGDR